MVGKPMYDKIQELKTKGYSKRRSARELILNSIKYSVIFD
jgi:hypothetical protein